MDLTTTTWTDFKNIVVSKGLQMQYYNSNNYYLVWASDGVVTYNYTIWQSGSEPLTSNTAQVASERTDFQNNYQVNCNARSAATSSFIATTGTITGTGQTVSAAVVGAAGCIMSFHGTYAGISGFFECSDDNGTTWYAIFGSPTDGSSSYSNSISSATNYSAVFEFDFGPITNIRFRSTAYTSGTMNVRITPSSIGPNVGIIAVGDVLSGNSEFSTSAPVKIGGLVKSTLPTTVSDGSRVQAMFDTMGRLMVVDGMPRQLTTQNSITLSSTTETTLLVAGGANVFLDMTAIVLLNSSATAINVSIRDATGGTVRQVWRLAAGAQVNQSFPTPWTQTTANSNWTAQLSSAVTSVVISAQAIQCK